MRNLFIAVLVFAELICSKNAGSKELPKNLAEEFCGSTEMALFLDSIALCEKPPKYQGTLFCGCGCTNDLNSLTVFEIDASDKVKVLLIVNEISNYKILATRTNGYRDISFIVWKDPENHSLGDVIDTATFNGTQYVKRTNHTAKIVLSDKQDFKEESVSIEKNLSDLCLSNNGKSNLSKKYSETLTLFKSGKKSEAAQTLLKAVGPKPWTIDNNNVGIFNDLGLFLEEAGQFQDAVDVLADVITKFPDRTPAYLNLADAYAGLKNNDKAKENYKKYRDLMTKAGKQAKIPPRVIDAIEK
jgi:tetratricopeptide (TPR) repeat protein